MVNRMMCSRKEKSFSFYPRIENKTCLVPERWVALTIMVTVQRLRRELIVPEGMRIVLEGTQVLSRGLIVLEGMRIVHGLTASTTMAANTVKVTTMPQGTVMATVSTGVKY